MDSVTFHYPPELFQLLVDTLPKLCRSKKDLLLFFQGAGVSTKTLHDLTLRVNNDSQSISKYEIARTVLTGVNEGGDKTLRERREILKRVAEFEDFSTCWPNDQLQAKGLVPEIRRVINVKDSFTRIQQEHEKERQKHQTEQQAVIDANRRWKESVVSVRKDLLSLFSETNARKRGKALEGVLNRLFEVNGFLIKEAFTLTAPESSGVVEQIDGAIELDGHTYLVEMKWRHDSLGVDDVSQHLLRAHNRSQARAIFISASNYTDAAISVCRDSLQRTVVVLCTLEEIVMLLEQESSLKDFLKKKVNAAIVERNPFVKYSAL